MFEKSTTEAKRKSKSELDAKSLETVVFNVKIINTINQLSNHVAFEVEQNKDII